MSLKLLSYGEFKNRVYQKYKGKEISFEKFKEMRGGLCGEADTVETVTEGLITANDARFFLINDWRVMVENCRCIPEEMSGKECFIGFIAKPYILLAVGLSVDGEEIVETFFDSSFTSTIAADLGM